MIENYLSTTEYKTRQQLVDETGMTDRTIRQHISDLKKSRPVLYNSQMCGYRLAKELKDIRTLEDARAELDKIRHCINDIEARKRDMSMSEITYIAYKKKLEQKIEFFEEGEQLCL